MPARTLRICLTVATFALIASTAGAIERENGRRERPRSTGYYPRPIAEGIARTPKRLGVFEIYNSAAIPTGTINHLGDIDFHNAYWPININADDVYKSSYTLGITLGIVRMGHWYNSMGFQYSHLRIKDTIYIPRSNEAIVFDYPDYPKPHFNQYELRFNSNYQFYDLETVGWTPYLGLGLGVGMISQTLDYYDTKTELNVGVAMNFGAEFKIWQDPNGRNMVALASQNSWEFAGSGYRPKYLTIGAALRIYTRM
ncbi:exported hypothetical protein [Candidatus Zixiibacteriota bacterium]|nr:exported hypothetical protein [candidate division Zixibacteria bacterium]